MSVYIVLVASINAENSLEITVTVSTYIGFSQLVDMQFLWPPKYHILLIITKLWIYMYYQCLSRITAEVRTGPID